MARRVCGRSVSRGPLPGRTRGGPIAAAETLRGHRDVVDEQREMEVGLVGKEVAGENAVESVVGFELLDEPW